MPQRALLIDALLASATDSAAEAAELERLGADGVWVTETTHDPFVQLATASATTSRVALGSAVAVAFARSPMTVAASANHLRALSRGRFVLGLGTQVKAHVERRYSMPWGAPVARIRDFVFAVRAIWEAWAESRPLRYEGRYYAHTLMSPVFDPGPNPFGAPPIYLGGVRSAMVEAVGEIADGFLVPPLATRAYLTEQQLPALAKGWKRAHAAQPQVEVCAMPMIVTGVTDEELRESYEETRARIAFYASTPTYADVFGTHGWEETQRRLGALARDRRWADLAGKVTDEMVETIAVVAPPGELLNAVRTRFAGVAERAILYPVRQPSQETWRAVFST